MIEWKMLPTKLHRQMEQAGADAAREYMERTGENNLFVIYEAMVGAAPKPPSSIEPEIVAVIAENKYQETDVIQRPGIDALPVGTELIDRAAYDLSKGEESKLVASLDLIGQGLAVADGAKNVDAIREEIHELQERDLDQLSLLIESKEALQRLAVSEKHQGSISSAADLEALAEKIRANAIAPITEGNRPPSRLALQNQLDRLKNASQWDDIALHSIREQLQECEEERVRLSQETSDSRTQLAEARRLLHIASIRLAQWLDQDDDPRKQIIGFLEGVAELRAPVEGDERKEFEAAWAAKHKHEGRSPFQRIEPLGNYRWGDVHEGWLMWQARGARERTRS